MSVSHEILTDDRGEGEFRMMKNSLWVAIATLASALSFVDAPVSAQPPPITTDAGVPTDAGTPDASTAAPVAPPPPACLPTDCQPTAAQCESVCNPPAPAPSTTSTGGGGGSDDRPRSRMDYVLRGTMTGTNVRERDLPEFGEGFRVTYATNGTVDCGDMIGVRLAPTTDRRVAQILGVSRFDSGTLCVQLGSLIVPSSVPPVISPAECPDLQRQLDDHERRIDGLEEGVAALGERADANDEENSRQNDRLDALEAAPPAQGGNTSPFVIFLAEDLDMNLFAGAFAGASGLNSPIVGGEGGFSLVLRPFNSPRVGFMGRFAFGGGRIFDQDANLVPGYVPVVRHTSMRIGAGLQFRPLRLPRMRIDMTVSYSQLTTGNDNALGAGDGTRLVGVLAGARLNLDLRAPRAGYGATPYLFLGIDAGSHNVDLYGTQGHTYVNRAMVLGTVGLGVRIGSTAAPVVEEPESEESDD